MGGPSMFSALPGISPATVAVLDSLGFSTATPVQEATIPLFSAHKDVAVEACTGSGKTLAFVVPVVEKLRKLEEPLKHHQVGAIIVSPTRELAKQIHSVAEPFVGSVPGLTSALLVGGTDPAADVAVLRENGAHVLIGTPGRIDDLLKRCTFLELKRLEVLVLDEADRLLDMGFKLQVDAIMARLPKQRRTGLFSATQTEAVEALARAGLRNPARINVAVTTTAAQPSANGGTARQAVSDQKTPSSLQLQYITCQADEKLPQLVAFLCTHSDKKIIVYFLTCMCVEFYATALKRLAAPKLLPPSLTVHALHGRMKQAAREATLSAFAALPAGVLLCTDLAARGLDIPDVHWIVQVDPPQDPSAFVHRVGRTARMGRTGASLVMLLPHEASYVDFLRLRKVPLLQGTPLPNAPDVLPMLRKEAESDRDVMERGTRAFVSFVRGYKEHHCKFIFRLQDLALGRLSTSFALLRLPRMPEVKRAQRGAGLEGFTESTVDIDSIRFKDKAREKQRQQALKQRATQAASLAEAKAAAAVKRAREAQQREEAGHLPAAKRRALQQRDELAELDHDYGMLRKLKKGKISQHDFYVATGVSSDEDEGDLNGEHEGAGTSGRAGAGGTASGGNAVSKAAKKKAAKKRKRAAAAAARASGGGDRPPQSSDAPGMSGQQRGGGGDQRSSVPPQQAGGRSQEGQQQRTASQKQAGAGHGGAADGHANKGSSKRGNHAGLKAG